MKKQYIIACILFSSSIPGNAKITPIKLETSLLKKFDGIFINWNIINFIKKYTSRMDQFLKKQYNLTDGPHTLYGLVRLEDAGILSHEAQCVLNSIIDEVIAFSEPFLDTQLHHVKTTLVELIEEDCTKRGRPDSILLRWAHVSPGGEHALFKKEINTYRTLCAFCVDISCFLEDLMHSCPKAMKSYEHELTRQNTLRAHINVLLAEQMLPEAKQKEIIQYIRAHYPQDAAITKEKTKELYHKYINTH